VLTQIYYVIFANDFPVGSTEEKEFFHEGGNPQIEYTVVARDRATDLASPESEVATKLEGVILVRSAEPVISGDVGVFNTLTSTGARIVGTKKETDLGSTVSVSFPEPPPIITSSDNFPFTVISRIFGWPAGGTTYTISAFPKLTYSNGSTKAGESGYILVTDGHRVQGTGRNQFFGTNVLGGGVLKSLEIELSKDLFFNFGEAYIRWDYTELPPQ